MGAETIIVSASENGKKSPLWNLSNDLNGELTTQKLFEYTKGALQTIFKIALTEEQNKGFDKKPVIVVDGKFNKPIDNVHPFGKIEGYARVNMGTMIMEVYEEIMKRSPSGTGHFSASNVVTFNGRQIASSASELKRFLATTKGFQDKDIFRFVNTTPYARKLERYGVTYQNGKKGNSKRRLSYAAQKSRKVKSLGASESDKVRVPNGVYALTYKFLQKKYSRNSFMRFRFLQGNELGLTQDSQNDKKNYRKYRKGSGKGRYYFYPTIIISAVAAGLKDGIEP